MNKNTLSKLIKRLVESVMIDDDLERQIEKLEALGEDWYDDRQSFVLHAMQEYEETLEPVELSTAELQLIARNESGVPEPSPTLVREIKEELITTPDVVIKFVGRQPKKNIRGFTSGYHGSSPYKGIVGGGTGMGTGFGGPVGFGMGGGPGSIGGKGRQPYNKEGEPEGQFELSMHQKGYDINDPRNLGFGAGKKVKKP